MKIRRAVLNSLVAIAAVPVAGCGGGDDGAGLSEQEYIAKADAICQKADKEQAALVGKETQGIYGNFSDAAYLSRYNAVTRDALKRLRSLDAPEEERKAADSFLAAVQASVASVDKRIAGLRARDLPGQAEANKAFQMAYGDIAASAGALGLTRCQGLAN